MRKLNQPGFGLLPSLSDLIEEAIQFLRDNEPEEGYSVQFSGGKDSQVILHLAILSKVKFQAFYACTRIDPPEIVKFIKECYPDVIFCYPKITFWQGIIKNYLPTIRQRWCCDVLKKAPTNKVGSPYQIIGIRKEESHRRAQRERLSHYKKKIHLHPILDWKEYHVWEFIDQMDLPYCELYDDPDCFRIGCVICPFLSYNAHMRAKKRYPYIHQLFEKKAQELWNGLKEQGRDMKHDSFDAYLDDWFHGRFHIFRGRTEPKIGFGL